jgi:hypothetical protein
MVTVVALEAATRMDQRAACDSSTSLSLKENHLKPQDLMTEQKVERKTVSFTPKDKSTCLEQTQVCMKGCARQG